MYLYETVKIMTLVHCYNCSASWPLSGSNRKSTKCVFILHCRANNMIDFGQPIKCYGDYRCLHSCVRVIIWRVCQYASLSGFCIILIYLSLLILSWSFSLLSMDLLPDILFSLIFVHYFLYIFFDYCLVLCAMLSVHVYHCSSVVHCIYYCYYCLWLAISQVVLKCSLMGLSWCVYVAGPGGTVQQISVLALCVVCFVWLVFLFLWCEYGTICHDDSDHLSLQLCHGSTVPHLPIELLQ